MSEKEQELPMTLPATSPHDDLPTTPAIVEGRDFPETSIPLPADKPSNVPTATSVPMELSPEPIDTEIRVPKSEPIAVPET